MTSITVIPAIGCYHFFAQLEAQRYFVTRRPGRQHLAQRITVRHEHPLLCQAPLAGRRAADPHAEMNVSPTREIVEILYGEALETDLVLHPASRTKEPVRLHIVAPDQQPRPPRVGVVLFALIAHLPPGRSRSHRDSRQQAIVVGHILPQPFVDAAHVRAAARLPIPLSHRPDGGEQDAHEKDDDGGRRDDLAPVAPQGDFDRANSRPLGGEQFLEAVLARTCL